MQNNYESCDQPIDLIKEAKDMAKRDWQRKSYTCQRSGSHHDLIPVIWEVTPKSKTVSTLMCKRCFQEIHLLEAIEYRN